MPGEDDPKQIGDRIARSLEELRGLVSPQAWARVDELLRTVLDLYGRGLERLVEVASEDGSAADLRSRLLADPLLASLLILHGVHPLDVHTRIERALERVRQSLGGHAGSVELLGIDEQGVARLQLHGTSPTLAAVVERVVGEAAPELSRMEMLGAQPGAGGLVQLGHKRETVSGATP
jgi:Fe-S cluster biogenesis protein NfuA